MDLKAKAGIGAALIGAAALGASLVAYSSAQQSGPEPQDAFEAPAAEIETSFSDKQEDEIRALMKHYLYNNPEIIIEAVNEYGRKQQAMAEERAVGTARANFDLLTDGSFGYVAGMDPDNADVIVIELFDYHCGFCKRATPLVNGIIQNEEDVKFIFREYPILRKESDYAAEVALAAREQGKFLEMHFAMMDASGVLTEDRVKKIAKDNGLDLKKLDASLKSKTIPAAITNTQELAQNLGVQGTPAFIVASADGEFIDVIEGFRPEDVLDAISEARAAAAN